MTSPEDRIAELEEEMKKKQADIAKAEEDLRKEGCTVSKVLELLAGHYQALAEDKKRLNLLLEEKRDAAQAPATALVPHTWSTTARLRNKEMHISNGNIAFSIDDVLKKCPEDKKKYLPKYREKLDQLVVLWQGDDETADPTVEDIVKMITEPVKVDVEKLKLGTIKDWIMALHNAAQAPAAGLEAGGDKKRIRLPELRLQELPYIDQDFLSEVCPVPGQKRQMEHFVFTDDKGIQQFVLHQPLTRPIPVDLESLAVYSPEMRNHPKTFCDARETQSLCKNLSLLIYGSLCNTADATGTEDTVHTVIDSTFLLVLIGALKILEMPIFSYRNAQPPSGFSSHQSGKRPDSFLYCNKFLLLVGEEKKTGTTWDTPEAELKSKLEGWSPILMGTATYVFGYVAVGSKIALYVVNADTLVQVSQRLDLAFQQDRITAITVILNLVSHLRYQQKCAPSRPIQLGFPQQRRNCTIIFWMDHVEKIFNGAEPTCKKLLQQLEKKNMPCLMTLRVVATRKGFRVHLSPVGIVGVPTFHTMDTLKPFLRNILTALNGLHSLGWGHTDLRDPNIILHNNTWYLIDYDLATPFGHTRDKDGDSIEASAKEDLRQLAELVRKKMPAEFPSSGEVLSLLKDATTAKEALESQLLQTA